MYLRLFVHFQSAPYVYTTPRLLPKSRSYTEVTIMNCIRCGRDAGYNRAVIDTVSGVELGGFCRNCEFDEFGRALDRFDATERECAMCNRDGHFAFAIWRPTLKEGVGRLVSEVEYEVGDRTPFLCDEHFHLVADGESNSERQTGRVFR